MPPLIVWRLVPIRRKAPLAYARYYRLLPTYARPLNSPQSRSSHLTPPHCKPTCRSIATNTMSFSSHSYQPASTLRSLAESRQQLEEARRGFTESRERVQLRPSHTFSRLPNFFTRQAELQAVGRALEEEPCFTVLFGASSVGKVVLLLQIMPFPTLISCHVDYSLATAAYLRQVPCPAF
jgi:hypothetical protein